MKLSVVFLLVIGPHLLNGTLARTWNNISQYHKISPRDPSLDDNILIVEADPLRFSPRPSVAPIASPSFSPPTWEPSEVASPALTVTQTPTTMPSYSHSLIETDMPSVALSDTPTSSPTLGEFAPNPVPSNPPLGYFNYDYRPSSLYGPGNPQVVVHNATVNKTLYFNNGWSAVTIPDDGYWNEFGENGFGPWQGLLSKYNPSKNQCSNIGQQSPIDIRPNRAECFEFHQIRSRPGDMNINNDTVTTKLIQGNKLRLLYSRRPCRDPYIPICAEPDPPNSDFPHNWGGYSDAIHVDFKVPSEHTIYGERFDGEMQIFHLHPGRKRTPAVSQVMRAADDPYSYNFMLQMVLDEFQAVYDDHQALCAQKIRRERRLVSMMHWLLGENVQSKFVDYTSWADFSTTRDDPNARELQSRFWYPHHEELVPSLYFYGYNGSLTEPPCGEWVTWYVTDTPMKVHIRQLEQLKRLIFTHVSPECEKTGVQFDESVARPIQDTFRRGVWRCTSDNFLPDADKTRY